MSPTDNHACEQLKRDYILEAIQLARSFASVAARSIESGDRIGAARAQNHAERFYSDAREMLSCLCGIDVSELVHQLAELRKRLDDLSRATRTAFA